MSEKAKSARVLMPANLGLVEQLRRDWVVTAEHGTTIEEVMDAQYWSHVAAQMNPFDTIEVHPESGEWLLKLRVINTGRNWAQMFEEHRYDLVKRAEEMPAAIRHKVEYKGTKMRFCIIRIADNEIIQKEFATEAEAMERLVQYEKTIGV